ncbi:armadillo repeat-containing 2 [Labeo rohita]|uniref:Armadillo repeat-containing 2 n=1 Tax=Labeo rohita TaxID=84645 RepID=A0A498LFL2_LABRO|nr:armadillo repeat-containing 2 [Labeo rohita]RXN16781.1 armadillo repeat-containing 2 [Labeo rohita]
MSAGLRRQTSAEIVSEARRSLRTLATQRPFTPQEKQRQLFGESSSRAHDGRPPSAFSLHARHFDAPDSRPGSGTRLSPLEHKPRLSVSLDEDGGVNEATLPKPPTERGNARIGSGGSRARQLRAASINRLPPMTPNTKNMSLEARIGADQPEDKLGHGDTGDDYMDESVFWNTKVLPVLQEFESFAPGDDVSDETVGELCNACNSLHDALAERGMLRRQFKKRSAILRTLFRLIDVGSDRLNLTLAKLILADLVVRLLFTLGNLTAKSTEARERVYELEGGIDVLLDLFQVYQETPSPPEREDVLVKLIRLLANLAIHPTVGTALAANTLCVQLLLEVLEYRCVQESEELVINAVATINNLSFYQGQSSVVRSQHTHISQLLLKLLLSSSMDAVLEATRVFGNLSQIKDVRHFIMQHKVEQFVVTLLDSKTPDVCFSACGVLINLSADPDNRATLRAEGTVQKLVECLRDFGPQDWHLAAVVCQTLWNCSLDGELQHTQELLEILQLYTDKEALQWPSDNGVRQVQEACWELLFLPVAERLRRRFHIEDTTGTTP